MVLASVSSPRTCTRRPSGCGAMSTCNDDPGPVSCMAFSSGQRGLDVPGDGFGLLVRRVALEHATVATDQELGEVPLDRVNAEQSALLVLQPLPQRMRAVAIDVDLGEQRKRHVVV